MTGFLLAGVGNVDLRKHTNFLVVSDSAHPTLPLGSALPMRAQLLARAFICIMPAPEVPAWYRTCLSALCW